MKKEKQPGQELEGFIGTEQHQVKAGEKTFTVTYYLLKGPRPKPEPRPKLSGAADPETGPNQ